MYLLWVMVVFLLIYIVWVVKGPSIWDKFLGLSLISTKIGILIIVFASNAKAAYLLDFAIVSILLWFACIIFTALFLLDRIKGGKK